ncbi:MAG: TonB-dependent receptor [Candidatus Eisenbacteria bacterium]|nr:TonB-dependent receptor [Candidatus Eisenbacteria bacterium]
MIRGPNGAPRSRRMRTGGCSRTPVPDDGRAIRARRGILLLVVLLLGIPLLQVLPAFADDDLPIPPGMGRISGRVTEREAGRGLAGANVLLVEIGLGAISRPDGRFTLDVQPGKYTVRVSFLGYLDLSREVIVETGQTATLYFPLEETVAATLDPFEIRADRPLIDVRKTSTAHSLTSNELAAMVMQTPTLDNIAEQQPGVVRDRGQLHFRGGRAEENLFVVDGIKVRDLLSGESMGNEVTARSASEVNVMTGGFDARYNQAMSGVVETRLREGSSRWHGAVGYETDVLLDVEDRHFANFELSGPNLAFAPLLSLLGDDQPDVTFFGSLSAELSDGYLPSVRDMSDGERRLRSSVRDQFLGSEFSYGDFFTPLAENNWRAVFKTAWKPSPDDKVSLSWTKSLSILADWGNPDIGEIDRNQINYPWSWAGHLDHHYTITRDVNILSGNWNRSLGRSTRTVLRLWRHYSGKRQDVFGKRWTDYDTRLDSEMGGDSSFVDTPYFVDIGDAPDWQDRYVVVWGLASEWEKRTPTHNLEWGWAGEYHDVQYMSLNARTVDEAAGLPLGDEFDLFHVTPNAGNLYAQDRFEYEGMMVNLGLIYDYWFPGPQVERALKNLSRPHLTPALRDKFYDETHELFGHRYKSHLSPRVGISFPVSEEAHLYFNYGHYSQRPPYYYVYAKTSSQSGEEYPRIGNPTLNPQISVSYEIGGEYQFSDETAAKATLFWKDMYDYPTSIRLVMKERTTSRSNFFMYWNMDYARSRGIELSLVRNRKNFLSGSLSYTYSLAKGKSSDPNKTKVIQQSGGDSREPTLEEEFLWWNRPHKLTAQVNFLVTEKEEPPRWLGFHWPQDLSARLYFSVRSGRPYTPVDASDRRIGDPYSRNGPPEATCDLSLTKGFRLSGRHMSFSLNVYNIFDYRAPYEFDPVTGEAYVYGEGGLTLPRENPDTYAAYLDATREARLAAFISDYQRRYGSDPSQALIDNYALQVAQGVRSEYTSSYLEYQNPSYYGEGRTFRVGLTYEW